MNLKRTMLSAFVILLALCAASPHAEEKFAAEVIERLKQKMPGVTFRSKAGDPLAIQFKGGQRSEGNLSLHRVFEFCKHASASECADEKTVFVENMAAAPPEPTAASLRLIVRNSEYLRYLGGLGSKEDPRNAFAFWEQIGDDLFALLAFDAGKLTGVLGPNELGKLGLTREQAWALALTQTKEKLPPLPTPDMLSTKAAVVFAGHEYLGSLLVDRPGWARLAHAIGPSLFVTVVSDELVVVGAIPDGESMDRVKTSVAKDCAGARRCISANVYRFRNGRWAVVD